MKTLPFVSHNSSRSRRTMNDSGILNYIWCPGDVLHVEFMDIVSQKNGHEYLSVVAEEYKSNDEYRTETETVIYIAKTHVKIFIFDNLVSLLDCYQPS